MIVCGDFFYSTKYWIEQLELLPCPTRSMGAGTYAEPLYTYFEVYDKSSRFMHVRVSRANTDVTPRSFPPPKEKRKQTKLTIIVEKNKTYMPGVY